MNLFLCLLLIPIVLLAFQVKRIVSTFSSPYYRAKFILNDFCEKMHSSAVSDSPELESNKPTEKNDRTPPLMEVREHGLVSLGRSCCSSAP